jgi:transcriptional regulator with XRE-family HTH domain
MDPETQRLINLLKATLRILGLSHREVARRIGMSPSYLSKLFSGVSDLHMEHVIQICRAAHLEPAEFFSLAYPRQPAGTSLAARQLRELLQTVQAPPAAPPRPTREEERQMEETIRTMLERILGRQVESA